MKVVVYIPAYNEEATIGRIIDTIKETYKERKGYKLEVIVVNDGSRDRTTKIALERGVRVITHPSNRGLGAATRTGMETAREMGADIAVKIDADYQHDPLDIERVITPILEDRADAVFGSRFLGSINYQMPAYRKMGNSFFSWITSKFTGLRITDGQTGIMAFHRRYLDRMQMMSDYNETQQLIIDAWRKNMRVVEVPVVFHKRTAGKSFISLKYPFKVLPNILRLYCHTFPLKIFVPLGSLVLVFGLLVGYFVRVGSITRFGDDSAVILIIMGVQILLFGLIADMISQKR